MIRILYVEDNAANLSLVERVARVGGHQVFSYTTAEDALQVIDELQPHLVLMDIQLAGKLSGLEAVRILRERGNAVPIVAVTAYAMIGDRDKALAAGCTDYLSKPLPIKDLVQLLARFDAKVGQVEQSAADTPSSPRVTDAASLPVVADKAPVPAASIPPPAFSTFHDEDAPALRAERLAQTTFDKEATAVLPQVPPDDVTQTNTASDNASDKSSV